MSLDVRCGLRQADETGPEDELMANAGADEKELYTVTLSFPWVVRVALEEGVSTQDAINIAITEVDEATADAEASRRELSVQTVGCPDPDCAHKMKAVMGVEGKNMILLTMDVDVQAASRDDAEHVAQRDIGRFLDDTPLRVVEVTRGEEARKDR